MAQSIEYKKLMTEIVYINLPGPREPDAGMSGGELLHGFLADLYNVSNQESKTCIDSICDRWNVVYRVNKS